jgi:hypothetical protein
VGLKGIAANPGDRRQRHICISWKRMIQTPGDFQRSRSHAPVAKWIAQKRHIFLVLSVPFAAIEFSAENFFGRLWNKEGTGATASDPGTYVRGRLRGRSLSWRSSGAISTFGEIRGLLHPPRSARAGLAMTSSIFFNTLAVFIRRPDPPKTRSNSSSLRF